MNIQFIPSINQTANLFHFISNLSNWHFSVRKRYAKKWIEQTGELTNKEKDSLSEISELFKKYTFGENYWGKIFLTKSDNSVWKEAEKTFGQDTIKFKELSDVFQKRFNLVWHKEKNNLKKWQKLLKKTKENFTNKNLIRDLNVLYGTTPKIEETIQINLLLGGPGGGANTTKYNIEMEVSGLSENEVKRVWAIIWHELIHKFWETKEYKQKIYDFSKKINFELVKGIPNHIVIKEMITNSLLPWGYFRKKYFKADTDEYLKKSLENLKTRDKKSLSYFNLLAASDTKPLIKDYLKEGKTIDADFLEKIGSLATKES